MCNLVFQLIYTMKRILFLILITVTCLLTACGSTSDATKLFSIDLEGKNNKFQNGDLVGVALQNKKNKTITNVKYSIDGEEIIENNGKLSLTAQKLGQKLLVAKVFYDDTSVEITKKISLLAANPPTVYTYEIVNEFPHDKNAFTQGLEFKNDTLFESTGRLGQSTLRKVEYKTGEVLQEIALKDSEFGEGLTLIDNKVIQLTWQNKIGYVYSGKDLSKIESFSYGESKEGWGLCNDGNRIYKSDGTEKIWILNPETYIEEDHIETVTNKSIFNKANELEFVDGKIYANVWQKESMMIINATSGAIEGVVNFSGLKSKVEQHDALDVLNGIAYHPERGTFFVTGKNWSKLFEVIITKK